LSDERESLLRLVSVPSIGLSPSVNETTTTHIQFIFHQQYYWFYIITI